jgi:nitrite reductase/ring-hydroxylating ferredoxin subunit
VTQTPTPDRQSDRQSVQRLRDELFTRRRVTGFAVAGAAVPLLAACGSDDESATDAGSGSGGSSSSATSDAPSSTGSSAGGDSGGTADGLASTSDIEVGGGTIFADEKVVITQPTAGEFKCFSAVCTHQGCLVSEVSDGDIVCTCHGSHFSISTGEPDSGPATSPLEEKQITVTGDQITLS